MATAAPAAIDGGPDPVSPDPGAPTRASTRPAAVCAAALGGRTDRRYCCVRRHDDHGREVLPHVAGAPRANRSIPSLPLPPPLFPPRQTLSLWTGLAQHLPGEGGVRGRGVRLGRGRPLRARARRRGRRRPLRPVPRRPGEALTRTPPRATAPKNAAALTAGLGCAGRDADRCAVAGDVPLAVLRGRAHPHRRHLRHRHRTLRLPRSACCPRLLTASTRWPLAPPALLTHGALASRQEARRAGVPAARGRPPPPHPVYGILRCQCRDGAGQGGGGMAVHTDEPRQRRRARVSPPASNPTQHTPTHLAQVCADQPVEWARRNRGTSQQGIGTSSQPTAIAHKNQQGPPVAAGVDPDLFEPRTAIENSIRDFTAVRASGSSTLPPSPSHPRT